MPMPTVSELLPCGKSHSSSRLEQRRSSIGALERMVLSNLFAVVSAVWFSTRPLLAIFVSSTFPGGTSTTDEVREL